MNHQPVAFLNKEKNTLSLLRFFNNSTSRHRNFKFLNFISILLSIFFFSFSLSAKELESWTFANGVEGWKGKGKAFVSKISRRYRNKSLQIKQSKDSEQESSWLSPVLKSMGKQVRVCFWAADNYIRQPDFSYSAAVGLVAVNTEGKTAKVLTWKNIPWDEGRREQWWGALTDAGLVWKYYKCIFSPPAKKFRVKFFWPKAIVRGECYITDVRVTDSDYTASQLSKTQIRGKAKVKPEYTLEISTPTSGNLFYSDDPLRFGFLLFDPSGKKTRKLSNPLMQYDITDFEGSYIAGGKISFKNMETFKLERKNFKFNRINNRYKSVVIGTPAAKEVGREFFFHAILRDDKKIVGEDTVPYGVVDPHSLAPEDYDKSLFIHFEGREKGVVNSDSKHQRQAIRDKMGISFEHDWDYRGWKKAQPKFPGPMKIDPAPDFPKLVYCPNLEQIRGRKPNHPWGDVGAMAPEGASFDDPLRLGAKTFNIDGYVAYIVARIKAQHNRIFLVVPSGLERKIDKRTIELQKKAYTAIKKEFPDLPVGMMLYGLFGNPSSQAKIFMKEKLYEYADFVDDHMYSPSMDWTEWKRIKKAVKAKGKDIYLVSTEFSRVGGKSQLVRSRAMVNSHLEAWANGMRWITYFNVKANVDRPVLRESAPGDGFQWLQRVKRPKIFRAIKTKKMLQISNMPLLQTMTYYNLVQNFEGAKFKTTFRPSKDTIVYVFSLKGKTICAFHLTKQILPQTLSITTDIPFVSQDLFGKTSRFEPVTAAIISSTNNPTVITFDREIPDLYNKGTATGIIKVVGSGSISPRLACGVAADLKFVIPGVFKHAFIAEVNGSVNKTWAKVKPIKISIMENKQTETDLPVTIDKSIKPGTYDFITKIRNGKRLVGILKKSITISDVISLQISDVPMLSGLLPAIKVTVRNLGDVKMSGTVELENQYFGKSLKPAEMHESYIVAPKSESTLRFNIPAEQINLGTSYFVTATLKDKSGIVVSQKEEVAFRASLKTGVPIAIDGDLADWKLEELLPIPFERYQTSWGKKVSGPKDLSARAYSRWNDKYLYFAAIVTDDKAVSRANDVNIWQDDNIMLGLYPWGWKMDEPLKDGYYREHLGLCADGKSRVFRVGNVPGYQQTAKGIKIAVKRTLTGYIYEWAYPVATILPLNLKPGERFRLSLAAIDRDDNEKTMSAVQLGGFNLSVDAQPTKWREFVLVGK